jgi:hypothetical protein
MHNSSHGVFERPRPRQPTLCGSQDLRGDCRVLRTPPSVGALCESIDKHDDQVDALTLFGLIAVTAMLVCYAPGKRSPWFILPFAVSCVMGSVYGFLQRAWPFGLVESIWSVVAARRWWVAKTSN